MTGSVTLKKLCGLGEMSQENLNLLNVLVGGRLKTTPIKWDIPPEMLYCTSSVVSDVFLRKGM